MSQRPKTLLIFLFILFFIFTDKGADSKSATDRTPLQAAIFEGRSDVVSLLLDKGGDLQSQKADEALLLACRIMIQTTSSKAAQNSAPIIKMLLDHGINPNLKIEHRGWTDTPLMEAVRAGNTAGVKLLLEAGADPRKVKYGRGSGTLLELVVQKKDPEITRALIPHFLPLPDEARESLIKAFLQYGNPVNLPVLNQYGIKISELKKSDPDAAVRGLVNAVDEDKMDMVDALLGEGVDINASGYNQTPLTAAVGYNNEKMADFLISRGADVNRADRTGMTPLAAAVGQANFEIYKFLRSKKADPVSKDPARPYLLRAVANLAYSPVYGRDNGSLDIIRDLLAAGNPADQADPGGVTPLWAMAAEQPRDSDGQQRLSDAAHLLLEHHATVDWVPQDCKRMLRLSQRVPAGASAEEPGSRLSDGVGIMDPGQQADLLCRTPLSNAAAAGNRVMAGILIAAGADVNWPSPSDGQTPLMHAAYCGDPGLVSLLLSRGADGNMRDMKNQTAADVARLQNNTKACAILKSAVKTGGPR
jgi:ankyrin repeat protein